MYTREEEIKFLNAFYDDYVAGIDETIQFLSSDRQKKYHDKSLLEDYKERMYKHRIIRSALRQIDYLLGDENTETSVRVVGNKNAPQAIMTFDRLRLDPIFISSMSEIAHNYYFNETDPDLSKIKLPADQIEDYLNSQFLDGIIAKEQLILYSNLFVYLIKDPAYLEIVGQSLQTPPNL